jgi:hypothetical protein
VNWWYDVRLYGLHTRATTLPLLLMPLCFSLHDSMHRGTCPFATHTLMNLHAKWSLWNQICPQHAKVGWIVTFTTSKLRRNIEDQNIISEMIEVHRLIFFRWFSWSKTLSFFQSIPFLFCAQSQSPIHMRTMAHLINRESSTMMAIFSIFIVKF